MISKTPIKGPKKGFPGLHQLPGVSFLKKDCLWQRLLLASALFIVVFLILYFSVLPDRVTLDVGRPSPTTIYAPKEAVDYHATELFKEEAAEAVPEAFDFEPAIMSEINKEFDSFISSIYEIRQMEVPEEEKVQQLVNLFPFEIDSQSAEAFITTERSELEALQFDIEGIIYDIMEQGVKEQGLENARRQAVQEIELLAYQKELKDNIAEVVKPMVRANMIYNEEVTVKAREQARHDVEPVKILKGTRIIGEGEMVTENHMAQMDSLGLQRAMADYDIFFGLALLLLAIFLVGGIYLYIHEKEVFYSPSLLLLLSIIIIITLIFIVAANFFSGFLIPTAMGIILITVLFNSRLAILFNVILAIFIGIITGGEFSFMVMALLGGLVAAYSVTKLYHRSDLTKAGLYVALVNVLVILSTFLFFSGFKLEYEFIKEFILGMISGVGSGLFSSVMAIGLLPFLESGFGLTTSVSLLELANPNQPLLKKLLIKAPGTYHHSIIVANLAEAAAEVVGGDPLLARVGAYYHDIGKVKRPYFFIENQLTNDNPHNKISASLSTLIITAHVKDGVEMAREAKLPEIITDFILQHHGTSVIAYFYHQATEKEKKDDVCEENFRYEGPKPQTKEAAIIMISDAVEAAVRAMSKPTSGRVEGLIRKIIKEKLNDGQLDESDLTLKDLDKIADALTSILSGIFHSRIEYPEKDLKAEIERGAQKTNAVINKGPSG
ncbi:HD family phosphohydrolase [Candidatus Contubernalis alkaliaceticus]|uniref:HD family phosphohydrolase n=1 Tax=Candidatus Contubernalis alkaliaceticus TaxID=338645 RepID=UPI001F4C2C78|nr:HDIG domain-containing metalloprotein [Candidatus Contubernalis alkalaceticus]UNC93129.1 HDIG domain-containing protein [Candidatus Contubernalis alkalaceticus]